MTVAAMNVYFMQNKVAVGYNDASGSMMDKTHILIMDKHARVRHALSVRLSSVPHFEVVGAVAELSTALESIKQMNPDVVLVGLRSDHAVHLNHSVTTVHELAKAGVEVVVLSPYMDEVERDLMLQSGAKRYLLKHIDTPELIREIDDLQCL
jgi:DNA-binding NarL/FixJ family response regulator